MNKRCKEKAGESVAAVVRTLHPLMHSGLGTLFHSQVDVQLMAATAANKANAQVSRKMLLHAMLLS